MLAEINIPTPNAMKNSVPNNCEAIPFSYLYFLRRTVATTIEPLVPFVKLYESFLVSVKIAQTLNAILAELILRASAISWNSRSNFLLCLIAFIPFIISGLAIIPMAIPTVMSNIMPEESNPIIEVGSMVLYSPKL